MPVTIKTCDFTSETWSPETPNLPPPDAQSIITTVAKDDAKLIKEILQGTQIPDHPVQPTTNGLLGAAIEAWNNHHNLVLRPEDFWFAILSQLSFYVTGNAEELRSHFVAHEGKKKLTVTQVGTIHSVDYGLFAEMMAAELGRNVVDAELKEWVLPGFTTTTDEDKVIGAVLFMGSMQKYFDYEFDCATCAIPKIVLLGEKEDWQEIQRRIDKFTSWGKAGEKYHKYLVPIFQHIVKSFDEPESSEIVAFWQKMVSWHGPDRRSGGKNAEYITGWITGLFMWDADGRIREEARGDYGDTALNGVWYPMLYLDTYLVPAVVSVPVVVREVDACGAVLRAIKTRIVTGICGFTHCETPEEGPVDAGGLGQQGGVPSPARRIADRISRLSFRGGAQKHKEKMKEEEAVLQEQDSVKSIPDAADKSRETCLSPSEVEELEREMGDGLGRGEICLVKMKTGLGSGSGDGDGNENGDSDAQPAGKAMDAVKPMAFWWIFETNEDPDE